MKREDKMITELHINILNEIQDYCIYNTKNGKCKKCIFHNKNINDPIKCILHDPEDWRLRKINNE